MLATLLFLLLSSGALASGDKRRWVDIWTAMPQLTEPANLPSAPFNETGVVFRNATIRQTLRVSLPASTIRLQISNAFGTSDLPITAATIARPANGSAGTSSIDVATLTPLTFSGSPNFTIPNAALALSDPVTLKGNHALKAGDIVTVSLYLATGQSSPTNAMTSHPGSRTTSYFVSGNSVSSADLTGSSLQSADHWYLISALSASLPSTASAVAIIGDSITDGRGSTTNANDRWTDALSRRLGAHPATSSIAVLNQAAGGNRVLYDGLGPNANSRVERDVIAQPGVRYAMVFEGVNDIGTAAADNATQAALYTRLTASYAQMIARMHAFDIPVFGCTITPFTGPGQTYSSPEREANRQRVNAWIRERGHFDGVVDFDAVVRNASAPAMLRDEYNSGDYLHLNPAGYEAMGQAVDLALFERFSAGVDEML
ncbi:GDSL-like Lipase/Acylhydrolase [Xylariaceae sp. FL0016]|nr:GDSL-like Lipase/Acylhydrolase [Xylariaceae sp. FL0016]